ncbi:glycosyltransferase family 2 protein [Candidatus Beckwithbacteria bacterium]|nr:glycosyltransferase family 2 protein [Candidatus Beckwithbacteria bacterium]
MTNNMLLSALVLTKNSENTIKNCIESLKFADEILILDDFSTDKTEEVIKEYQFLDSYSLPYKKGTFPQLKFFQQKLNGDFSAQRNFILRKAKGKWFLFIDSDEVVDKNLRKEIIKVMQAENNPYEAFYLKRQDFFLGKKLKFGETANNKFIRFAKIKSPWVGKVHEIWNVQKPGVKIGELKNPIIHNQNLTITDFLNRINFYSNLRAEWLYEQKVKEATLKTFFNPVGKFLNNYFLKLGILDGFEGFCLSFLMSLHSLLVRIKLQILWLQHENRQI